MTYRALYEMKQGAFLASAQRLTLFEAKADLSWHMDITE